MRRFLLIVVPVLSLAVGVMVAFRIPSHDGDGDFKSTPIWYGPLPNRGYTISFPEFDVASKHKTKYELSNLPDIGKVCGVYLAIHDPSDTLVYKDLRELAEKRWGDEWTQRVTRQVAGRLTLQIKGSEGSSVKVSGSLGSYDWAREGDLHLLYDLEESFFTPVPGETYKLKVSYTPDRRLSGWTLFVYLRSGDPEPAREILPDEPEPEPQPQPDVDFDADLGGPDFDADPNFGG